MSCNTCTRQTLGLFIRSLTGATSNTPARHNALRNLRCSRNYSTTSSRPAPGTAQRASQTPLNPSNARATLKPSDPATESPGVQRKEKESWQIHKAALKEKFGNEAWNPRKKLSPDTMEGIRHLHQTSPEMFTTPVLAEHFKVSPEAIRRILKSKWRPSDEEQEDRLRRWDQRGERIWSNLVELGVKPPKKWREMGVGKARSGGVPRWKARGRNQVAVGDSLSDDIIPTVGHDPEEVGLNSRQKRSLSERL